MIEGLAIGITLATILIATIEYFEKKSAGPVDDDLGITEAILLLENWKK